MVFIILFNSIICFIFFLFFFKAQEYLERYL